MKKHDLLQLFSWYMQNTKLRTEMGFATDRRIIVAYSQIVRAELALGGDES